MDQLINTQECVDYMLAQPLSYLVAAQKGALAQKATGEWSAYDEFATDLLETVIAFRLDEGLTL